MAVSGEFLRPYLDGRVPEHSRPARLLQSGRADVEVLFIETVGKGSGRAYYPADQTEYSVVAPLADGVYTAGSVCEATLGADGRVARIYPPAVLGDGDRIVVGEWTEEIAETATTVETHGVVLAAQSQVITNHETKIAETEGLVEEIKRRQSDTNLIVEEFGKEVERSSISVAEAVRTAQAALTTAVEGVPAVVKVESSRGTAFKNNTVSTDLRATVFYGPKTITTIQELWDEFGGTAFLEWWWRREDDAKFGLISASDDRLSRGGFWLTVSPDDVDAQTTFRAVLNI